MYWIFFLFDVYRFENALNGNTHHTDILKHLNDCGVHEIVARPIVQEGLNDRLKEKISHYVAIVEFILQTNDPPHKAQGTWEQNIETNAELRFI